MSYGLHEAKEGDKLAIYTRARDPNIRTVARVTKLHVIDECGVKWRRNGRRVGASSWSSESARIASDEDFAAIDRAQIARTVTDRVQRLFSRFASFDRANNALETHGLSYFEKLITEIDAVAPKEFKS